MILRPTSDTPQLSEPIFDVCVAGGGVAGIAIALRLAAAGRRVALLEAGGLAGTETSQEFYRGENTGTENLLLHETRLRMLGGSSNHWGGWCRQRDPYDFERADLTGASWPIGAADLDPYFTEASTFLGVTRASGARLGLDGSRGDLETSRIYFSNPPARIGELYFDLLSEAPGIVVSLNSPVVAIDVDETRGAVSSLSIRSVDGKDIRCHARLFVLAMGAVENARTLLIWNRNQQDRLGNQSGLVGRYYIQHLHQALGEFVLFDDGREAPPVTPEGSPRAFFTSTPQYLQDQRTGTFRLYSAAIGCTGLKDEFSEKVVAAACPAITAGGALFITAEQMPNAESRVHLSQTTDAFGRPRVHLDWRLSDFDARTMREAAVLFGRYLIDAGLGRLKVNADVLAGDQPLRGWTALPSAPGAAGHQMGGCRMSATPSDGVVNRDCLVWGTTNLYVAGAGVFRTGGEATPTLTIVQLGFRLADRLHAALA